MGMDESYVVKVMQDAAAEQGKNYLKTQEMMFNTRNPLIFDTFLQMLLLPTGMFGASDPTPAFRSVIGSMEQKRFPTLTYTSSVVPSNPDDCASATYSIVGQLADGTSINKNIDPIDKWSIYKEGECVVDPNHDMLLNYDYFDIAPSPAPTPGDVGGV